MKCLENRKRDRNYPELCGEGIDNVIKEITNLEMATNTGSAAHGCCTAWLLILMLSALPIAAASSAVGGGSINNTESFLHKFTIAFCHSNRRSYTHSSVADVLTNLGNLNVRTNRKHISAGSQTRGLVLRDGTYCLDFSASSALSSKLQLSGILRNLVDFVIIKEDPSPVLYMGSITSKEVAKLTLMEYFGRKLKNMSPSNDEIYFNNQQVLHVDHTGMRNFWCLANYRQDIFHSASVELKQLIASGSWATIRKILYEQRGPNLWATSLQDQGQDLVSGIPLPPPPPPPPAT